MTGWLRKILDGLLGPPNAPPPPKPGIPPRSGDFALDFLASLNRERAARHLPPMALDPQLTGVAQGWAEGQASEGRLSHDGYPGRVRVAYPDRASAENVAEGSEDVASTFARWMNSPPHFRNMMGEYRLAGIGRARTGSGRTYWCADFVA